MKIKVFYFDFGRRIEAWIYVAAPDVDCARSGGVQHSAALQATGFIARSDEAAERTHPLRREIAGLRLRP